jgi:hypothetical protein
MPLRSDHPGLKYRQTVSGRQPYWVARQVIRDPRGYPNRTVRLPKEADEETIGELCRAHTAKLLAWLAGPERSDGVVYDGTLRSLSRLYQRHPDSPFHEVKRNTRKNYADNLKVIEATVGNRLVRVVTVIDVKRWHKLWGAPVAEGGAPRPNRAHDAVRCCAPSYDSVSRWASRTARVWLSALPWCDSLTLAPVSRK